MGKSHWNVPFFCIFVVCAAQSLQSPHTNCSEFVSWKRNFSLWLNLGPKYSFTSYLTACTAFGSSSNMQRLLMFPEVDSSLTLYFNLLLFVTAGPNTLLYISHRKRSAKPEAVIESLLQWRQVLNFYAACRRQVFRALWQLCCSQFFKLCQHTV